MKTSRKLPQQPRALRITKALLSANQRKPLSLEWQPLFPLQNQKVSFGGYSTTPTTKNQRLKTSTSNTLNTLQSSSKGLPAGGWLSRSEPEVTKIHIKSFCVCDPIATPSNAPMHPSYPAVIPCYPITPTPNYHKNTPDSVHTPRTLKRPFDPLKKCTLIFAASFFCSTRPYSSSIFGSMKSIIESRQL